MELIKIHFIKVQDNQEWTKKVVCVDELGNVLKEYSPIKMSEVEINEERMCQYIRNGDN